VSPGPRRGGAGWARGFPPASKPRPVTGGLVARSARGDIGEHWWARRFVEVLESFAMGSRLTRGKAYARRGQVLGVDVAPGVVTARVQGSRSAPYRVTIAMTPLTELVWAKTEVALAEQAIHCAHLLAGQLAPELEEVFAAAGAPLFPGQAKDLELACSCPDWEVPCKHLAATFYLLAESFDDDPFRILHWRGRSRQVLLTRLRALRGDVVGQQVSEDSGPGAAVTGDAPAARLAPVGAAMALGGAGDDGDAAPAAADRYTFWDAPALPASPLGPELPVDLLLRQLPTPSGAIGGAGMLAALQPLYATLPGPVPGTSGPGSKAPGSKGPGSKDPGSRAARGASGRP
jgi:uncharacterized Zn finger protein